jgi:chitodextrinase
MKNFTKSILFLTAGLMMAVNVCGESNLCSVAPEHPAATGGTAVVFSWNTADNGDVVVSIAPSTGTSSATFRENGFTGDVDQFKVLSGEGFATEENASKYFYEKSNVNGSSTYTLYRTGNYNLPSPCKIKFVHGAVEWTADGVGPYDNTSDIIYNYGTLCGATLDAPVVSVNSAGIVTFDNVAGADSYKVYVYMGGELATSHPVTSGQKVFNPYLSREYAIYVRAFNSSTDAYSDFSNSAIWNATGDPAGDMPKSAVSDYYLTQDNNVNTEAYLSFYTDRATGNFYITVRAGANGDDSKTFFRDAGGMALGGFRYDGNTFTDYFTRTIASDADINGKVNTLEFVPRTDEGHIPEYGHTITFLSGNYVTWRTYNNGSQQNPYVNNLSFSYTYGETCDETDDHTPASVELSIASTTTTSATLQIDVTDKNDYNENRAIRSLTIRDAAHGIAEQKAVLDGSNQITLSELKKNTSYNFTVKAVDSGGNVTEETIKVPLTFDVTENLAYKRTCSAGGAADPATQANDGNQGTHWGTYGLGDYGTKNYWTVTLDEAYVLNKMSLYAGGYGGGAAHKVTLQGKMREEDAWSDIITDMTVAGGSDNENIAINAAAKYLKVSAAADENWMFAIDEFEVYGTDYAVADAVAPVVTVTEISKTVTSVILQIDATDKDDAGDDGTINAIHISGDNGFVTQNDVTLDGSNRITLSGLKDNTTYTFTVHVIDLAGNETTKDIVVELPFNTNLNLCHAGTATDGYHENTNTTAAKAIDGVADTKWNSWNVGTSEGGYANNWMRVDLGSAYNLRNVTMSFDWHYGNPVSEYVIEGSLDDSNWYLIDHVTNQSATSASLTVSAPAQYVRFRAITERSLGIYEFEVYASGFSTLEDAAPVVTYAKVGLVEDATAEIEIDAADITTKPITKYMVSGLGGDAQELTASDGKITLTSLSQSTHYTVDIQAKDESGNLSAAKQVEFTTTGSVSGLYCYAGFFGWEEKTQDRARFTTTAEPNVLTLVVSNMAAGDQNFKLYNADADRCTYGDCAGPSDHHFAMASAADVTFYAIDEDHFICTADNLYLRGSLVGDDKALVWNEDHTVATWAGALDLSGTKQFTIVKKNGATQQHVYDHDFYTEAQTFDGDYVYGMFTLDLTKMTGTWGYVELAFADEATDNTDAIAENNERVANVTINRTIEADNTWYTLCLPFDMDADKVSEVFGASTIATLVGSEDRGSLIHLNFDYVSAIQAGKPYLIKPGQTFTAGTTISGVTIKNVDPSAAGYKAEAEHMYFQGTFNKIMLQGEDKRYVSENNELYAPNPDGGSAVGAFRCYFTIPDGSPALAPGKRAVIVFGPQQSTGIDQVVNGKCENAKIMLDGVLYIIRDGKTYNAQGMLIK